MCFFSYYPPSILILYLLYNFVGTFFVCVYFIIDSFFIVFIYSIELIRVVLVERIRSWNYCLFFFGESKIKQEASPDRKTFIFLLLC